MLVPAWAPFVAGAVGSALAIRRSLEWQDIPEFHTGIPVVWGSPLNAPVGDGRKVRTKGKLLQWRAVDTRPGGTIALKLEDIIAPSILVDAATDINQLEPVTLGGDLTLEVYTTPELAFRYISVRDPEGLAKAAAHAQFRAAFLSRTVLDCLRATTQQAIIQEVLNGVAANPPHIPGIQSLQALFLEFGLQLDRAYLTRFEPEDEEMQRIWEGQTRERAERLSEDLQAETDTMLARRYVAAQLMVIPPMVRQQLPDGTRRTVPDPDFFKNAAKFEKATDAVAPKLGMELKALRAKVDELVGMYILRAQNNRIQLAATKAKDAKFVVVTSEVWNALGALNFGRPGGGRGPNPAQGGPGGGGPRGGRPGGQGGRPRNPNPVVPI